jgi:hypothetical protein
VLSTRSQTLVSTSPALIASSARLQAQQWEHSCAQANLSIRCVLVNLCQQNKQLNFRLRVRLTH